MFLSNGAEGSIDFTRDNDADFEDFASCLTDGADGVLRNGYLVRDGGGKWGIIDESNNLKGRLNADAPDLAGHRVLFARLLLTQVSIIPENNG